MAVTDAEVEKQELDTSEEEMNTHHNPVLPGQKS